MSKLFSSFLIFSGIILAQGGPAGHIRSGPTLPSKCSLVNGDVFILTSGAVGQYYCYSPGPPADWRRMAAVTYDTHTQNTDTGTSSSTYCLNTSVCIKNDAGVISFVDNTGTPIVSKASEVDTGDGTKAGEVRMYELTANGSNYIAIGVPDSITTNLKIKFPDASPGGQFLHCSAPVAGVATCNWTTIPDPSVFTFVEDFACEHAMSTSYGIHCEHGWKSNNLGTTAPGFVSIDSVANHPGILRLATTNAQADNGGTLEVGTISNNLGNGGTFSTWSAEWTFQLATITSLTFRIGFAGDYVNITPSNFIGLRFVVGTDTNWTFETRSGCVAGTEACATSTNNAGSLGIAPNTTHWMKLVMSSSGGGSIVFTLYDLTSSTSSTYTNSNSNVPTTVMMPFAAVKQSAAQVTTVYFDRFVTATTGLTR